MSDRVLVMREGRLVAELSRDEATQERDRPGRGGRGGGRVNRRLRAVSPQTLAAAAFRLRELGIFVALARRDRLLLRCAPPTSSPSDNWQDIAKDVAIVVVRRRRRDDGRADAQHRPQRRLDRRPHGLRLRRTRSRTTTARRSSCIALLAIASARCSASSTACSSSSAVSRRSSPRSATLAIYRGLAFQVTGGQNVISAFQLPDNFLNLAATKPLGVPTLAWIALGVALVGAALLRWAPWGRDFYAIGSNPDAARFAGIPVGRRVIAGVRDLRRARRARRLHVRRRASRPSTPSRRTELRARRDHRRRDRRRQRLRRLGHRARRRARRAARGDDPGRLHAAAARPSSGRSSSTATRSSSPSRSTRSSRSGCRRRCAGAAAPSCSRRASRQPPSAGGRD